MNQLSGIEPKKVFEYFEELNQVPRGTFDTARVSDWLVSVARRNRWDYIQDELGDVIIRKDGTPGYEDSEPVILQGHMDMVCEKTEDSDHDFGKDPIDMYVEDGFVKARGTTLGADDGIAIAMAFAVLSDETVPHPPLEVVFTIDEETGMGGANGIDLSVLKGKKLINLDTDIEGNIIAGCAGGVRGIGKIPIQREEMTGSLLELRIKGLRGGHSGLDIGEQRGNSNRMMGRLLYGMAENISYGLVDFDGGKLDNVICLSTSAHIVVEAGQVEEVKNYLKEMKHTWDVEFAGQEPQLEVFAREQGASVEQVMTEESKRNVLRFVTMIPYGVQCYSRQLPGLVETSNNLGMTKTSDELFETWGQARTSIASKMTEMKQQFTACAEACGGTAEFANEYPGWMYKDDSVLRPIVEEIYRKLYNKEPNVATVHAGLECGIFLGKKPDLDCVSFGPNMYDCHSVKERLDIASMQRTYHMLLEVLKACK